MLHRSALALLLAVAGAVAADPLAIGASVPALPVVAPDGAATTIAALRGNGPLMLMSWCSSCHSCRRAEKPFDALVAKYREQIHAYALAANPAETPTRVQARQRESGIAFPVVLDRERAVVDGLGITCTTTVVLLDASGALAYRGAFADPGTQAALEAVVAGKQPVVTEVEQFGCPLQ